MICEICKKDFISYKALSSHIRQTHKITSEKYYRQFNKFSDKCKMCGKPVKFINLALGYRTYCSCKCQSNDPDIINKATTTFLSNSKNSENARRRMITYNQSEKGRLTSSRTGKITGGKSFKKAHKNDKILWCNNCNQNTMHILGIGCISCYNKDKTHKENIRKSIQTKYGEHYINAFMIPEVKAKLHKHYKYDNIFFDSSWELAVYIWHTDNNIQIVREPCKFEYYVNTAKHYYYPDFLINGTIIEIKPNWQLIDNKILKDCNKQKCIEQHNVIIWNDEIVEPYIVYCQNKFNNKQWHKQFIHYKNN